MSITITIKTSCLVIKGIAFLAWFMGLFFSWYGSTWYKTLVMPCMQPSEHISNIAWFLVFFCTSTATFFVWNRFERNGTFWAIISLLSATGFLYVLWNYLFFFHHYLGVSLITVSMLEVVTVTLIYLLLPLSRAISALLFVQAAWLIFEIFLNLMIWYLN